MADILVNNYIEYQESVDPIKVSDDALTRGSKDVLCYKGTVYKRGGSELLGGKPSSGATDPTKGFL